MSITVYVFPGQGSQKVGMGEGLFETQPELVARADDILGYSIQRLCLEDPDSNLNSTDYTQPALFTVNALTYLNKVKQSGHEPDFVAGHSLGEYNALFAAQVFDFDTGLKLVKKRGEIMSKAHGGGMAAVVRISPEKTEEVLRNAGIDSIDIANYNAPMQTVISGRKDDIDNVSKYFDEAGAVYVPLKVSGAFHSRYMKDAPT